MKSTTTPPQLHHAIPRVLCPECGAGMRLAKIEPVDFSREEHTTFDCHCGFSYTCSTPRHFDL